MRSSVAFVDQEESKSHINGVDSFFVAQVNEFIANETAVIDPEDKEGRFFVFQTALQMIINQCPTMRSVLSSIEDCYGQLIELHVNEAKSAVGDEVALNRTINCQASIRHQEKRIAQMKGHLRELQREQDDLQKKLDEVENEIVERNKLLHPDPDPEPVDKPVDETDMKYFVLESVDEENMLTDLNKLEKRLAEMNGIIETANKANRKSWIPIEEYERLEEKLQTLTSKRLEYAENCSTLYLRHERLRYTIAALRAVVSGEVHAATVGEAILRTFKSFKTDRRESMGNFLVNLSDQTTNFRGETAGGQKEQITNAPDLDMSLAEWLRKTHQSLSNGNYKEAAETAASAPSGVLCNLATLTAFRNAMADDAGISFQANVPVLYYLEAVLGPLTANYSLSERFITACVSVALEYDSFWLISSWIAKRRLPFSANIVKLLLSQSSRYLPLAESLCRTALSEDSSSDEFSSLLLECLFMQNRISAAAFYIRQRKMPIEQCAVIFVKHPTPSFLHELVKQSNGDLSSLLALFEALPPADKLLESSKFQTIVGSELIDDELLVLLRNEKAKNPAFLARLDDISKQLSQCGLSNIASRLVLVL